MLAAVLGIWGTVAFKIVNGISPDQPQTTAESFDVAFNPEVQKDKDTFSIQTIDRDPFLGTLSAKKQASKRAKSINVKPNTSGVAMPIITYGGSIQKQNSKEKVFVVNINNKQYLLKVGQVINDVKLIRGNKESIVIRFNGTNQTIKL